MGNQRFNFLGPVRPDNVTVTEGANAFTANYLIINSSEPNESEGYVVRLAKWNGATFDLTSEHDKTVGGSGYSESGFFSSLLKGVVYKISVFADDACASEQLSSDSTDAYFQAGEFPSNHVKTQMKFSDSYPAKFLHDLAR